MTKERIEEIKESIEWGELLLKDNEIIKEEKEMLDEILRLQKVIDNIRDYLYATPKVVKNELYSIDKERAYIFLNKKFKDELIDILGD